MKLQVTLELNAQWSSYLTREELEESLRSRLDTGLGFRGKTDKLKIVERRPGTARKGNA